MKIRVWGAMGIMLICNMVWADTNTATTGPVTEKVEQMIMAPASAVSPEGAEKRHRFFSQDENYKVQTLFDNSISAHGGFGGPGVRWTKIDGANACLVGGQGAWVINHSLMIGGGGYGLSAPKLKRVFAGEEKRLEFGYGGVILGYSFHSEQLLHFNVQTLIGGGGIGYWEEEKVGLDRDGQDVYDHHGEYDGFFVLDPMVSVELNVTEWFRIALGGGYRLVGGVELPGVSDQDLSGPTAELLFKFGYF